MGKRLLDMTSFSRIAELDIPLMERRMGEVCVRIHRTMHDSLWFGPDRAVPVSGRFNAPNYEYGVCYFGMSCDGAFAETLLRNPGSRLLSRADLAVRSVSTGHLTRAIRLVQLHGPGLVRVGISAQMIHGPHEVCRHLALELWKHPEQVDGIAYRSRFDNDELCIALFDRASDAVKIDRTERLLEDTRRLGELLHKYDVGLDP